MSGFGRVLRVRPGEGRTVGLVVAMMFVTVAGQTVGESGVGALFFDRVGTSALPLMYLLQGATGLVAMLVLTGSLGHGDRRRTYVAILLALTGLILVERALAIGEQDWVYAVLWLTASGLFAVYVSQFGSYNKTWGTLSAVVILLTWLWLSGVALLLGAEINAEAERTRELRRGEPAEVELQAPRKQ